MVLDLAGNIHVVLLLLVPVTTLVACLTRPRRMPSLKRFTFSLLGSALLMAVMFIFSHHMTLEGNAVIQWVLPGISLFLCLCFLKVDRERRTAAALCVVMMLLLSQQFDNMVRGPFWTGNPDFPGMAKVKTNSLMQKLEISEEAKSMAGETFPEGWLRESPLVERFDFLDDLDWPVGQEIQPVWHSSFTGLYRTRPIEQDYWYPGGPLGDAAERLDLKDRAHPPPEN